ncbi:elongation factor P maturation arginine rhamnosyltransferase EarP [Paludibacterium yongneupense]|uniref:elongation factor P maturation arginine rhamnosyltransferase EarP n=1 Tax=Paludibacterium yongneupense TaxID=400061 RepID=UPI00040FDE77|nr:elongation factor P maturation arginine rhamnosyltransferase EarP [Paludibacterium yongneupense]
MKLSWDIFCTVIDNYGDIGVAWRLARQLAHERGQTVRLWVDDLCSFAHLAPGLDPGAEAQTVRGIGIRRWHETASAGAGAADVVIAAFGCRLPEDYLAAMAARARAPVWLNLEYLSAEDWVASCHGQASPHPRLPLTQHFYFPGFGPGCGGLLAEAGLLERVARWQANPRLQQAWWERLGVPARRDDEIRISVFCYPNPALPAWLEHLAAGPRPCRLLVPQGKALPGIVAALGGGELAPGQNRRRGALSVHCLPFTDQNAYDRLLWSCDINLVRGEDSFVRAQWAMRPFLWHIYPQDEDAHMLKLDAFLSHYGAGLPADRRAALNGASHAWNRGEGLAEVWDAWVEADAANLAHAQGWARHCLADGDLAGRMVQFVEKRIQ